ncbi:MAG: metal-sulfur cluster assembly factor [Bacteroidota bacterium]|nr:metal-sulfur cluster assembly factor [Bacteroidota bacterium]
MTMIVNTNTKLALAIVALKDVDDPEIGLNVVDLGLIYQVDFDDMDEKIYCTMTLTTQFCPMGQSISDNVSNTFKQLFKDYSIDVKVIFEPRWNAELISEEGREFLNQ